MYTPSNYTGKIPLNSIPVKVSNNTYSFIKKNSIQCKRCGEVITSTSQHDFVQCKCNACFVDGGLAYVRIGGNATDYIPLTEYGEATEDEYKEWRDAHEMLKDYKHKRAAELLEILEARDKNN